MQVKEITPPTGLLVSETETQPLRYEIQDHPIPTSEIDTGSSLGGEEKPATQNSDKGRFARIYDLIKEAEKKGKKRKGQSNQHRQRIIAKYKEAMALVAELKLKGEGIDREV